MTPAHANGNVLNPGVSWQLPSRGRVGMYCLICAESAILTIFFVAYIFYIGKSLSGPKPADVLHAPIVATLCLLASSLTIHAAVRALERGRVAVHSRWWALTIVLGVIFLASTAREWRHLIADDGLTISTNLFGTTYYSLVGLHAFHVTVGLVALTLVSIFGLLGFVKTEHAGRVSVLAMYWHFVDAIWVAVFTVVYVIGV